MPCGILIPWVVEDAIWGIKVRRVAGAQRYQQVGGGNIRGCLYLADRILPRMPLIITEGEFDALIAWAGRLGLRAGGSDWQRQSCPHRPPLVWHAAGRAARDRLYGCGCSRCRGGGTDGGALQRSQVRAGAERQRSERVLRAGRRKRGKGMASNHDPSRIAIIRYQIVTAGRTDVGDFFKLSAVFTAKRLNHTPLLVFTATEDSVQVPAGTITSCRPISILTGWRRRTATRRISSTSPNTPTSTASCSAARDRCASFSKCCPIWRA